VEDFAMAVEGVFRSGLETLVRLKDAVISVEYGRVKIGFVQPRGFGNSDFDLHVLPDSYADLARAMLYADFNAAMRAFGTALQEGVRSEPPKEVWVPSMHPPQTKRAA
jgi:hypothetical protein